jgi:hypothetical protein
MEQLVKDIDDIQNRLLRLKLELQAKDKASATSTTRVEGQNEQNNPLYIPDTSCEAPMYFKKQQEHKNMIYEHVRYYASTGPYLHSF